MMNATGNRSEYAASSSPSVSLYWLPLGAGGRSVRWNGRVFEVIAARHEHRAAVDLYHSALEVRVDGSRFVIEMAPAWGVGDPDRGVVLEGPVGAPWLGRSALFRYEVRRWRGGTIPDVAEAVDSPRQLRTSVEAARLLLDLVPTVPAHTWGRDELRVGDMWNSNSLTSWLLARSGHEMTAIGPPSGGRAPGWDAGLVLAGRRDRLARPRRIGADPELPGRVSLPGDVQSDPSRVELGSRAE